MKRVNVKELTNLVKENVQILCSIGAVAGTGLTGYYSYEAGKKMEKLEEKNWKDVVKIFAKPVLSGAATIGCIGGINYGYIKKYAALMGMYTLSQTDLKTYKEKVLEVVGADKKKEIDQKAETERKKPVYIDNFRQQTFIDKVTGRAFASTVHKIDEAVAKTNALIVREGRANLNEFYDFLGLDEVELGELIQWHQGDVYDVLEIRYDSEVTQDMMPVMTISYNIQDHYGW